MEGSQSIKTFKKTIRRLFLTHMGDYIRSLYFQRQLSGMPTGRFSAVLDAGCGDGSYVLYMASTYPHLHVTGKDIMEFKGSNPFPNAEFVRCDLAHLADHEEYDFIYCIDVLEHIPDNSRVVQNIFTALKPGGFLYVHTPDRMPGKHILPAMFLKNFHKWEEEEHIGDMYTLEELEAALRQRGFDILLTQHTFGLVGQFAWELDRMTDMSLLIKVLLMPFLKILAHCAVRLPAGHGDLMVVARKPYPPGHL